jgi:hypothetical protein
VITDAGADPQIVDRLRELGVEVRVVPVTEDRVAGRRSRAAHRA